MHPITCNLLMDDENLIEERLGQTQDSELDDNDSLSDAVDLIVASDGSSRASRLRLFCFFCNRTESHFYTHRKKRRFPFLVGATFGLIYLYGPFTCRCCGHQRRFRYDAIHPRIIWKRLFG